MRAQEAVNQRYQSIAARHGICLEIIYAPGLPKAQDITERDGRAAVWLNADRISEADYEEYLSYNVRKIVLPRLRLETPRLTLRPFDRGDAEACFAFLSDRESAYMDDGTFFTAMDETYQRLMDDYAAQTRYMIVDKASESIVGTINLLDVNDRAVAAKEIGYCVSPGFRRRGYAYEALSALLRCLLYDLGLELVIAGVLPDNVPSQKLIEKLGFRYEGRKRKALWNHMRGVMDLRYYYLEKFAVG